MAVTSSLPSEGKAVSAIEKERHQDEEDLQALLATDLDQHFPVLVSRYESRLIAHAYSRVGVRQDAEEVVQDSFERAYYALKGYPYQRIRSLHLQAWLYTIVTNLCSNRLLKEARTPSAISLDGSNTPEEEQPALQIESDCSEQPEVVYEEQEHIQEIEQAIRALPAYCREVLRLHIVEGLRCKEIADGLGKPVGTIKCYINRGRAILQASLKEQNRSSNE